MQGNGKIRIALVSFVVGLLLPGIISTAGTISTFLSHGWVAGGFDVMLALRAVQPKRQVTPPSCVDTVKEVRDQRTADTLSVGL